MTEHQCAHTRTAGDLDCLPRRGVIIEYVGHHPGQALVAALTYGLGKRGKEMGGQGFVHEQVGPTRIDYEILRGGRVAADNYRATAEFKTVAIGRADRCVVDRKGRHAQPTVIKNDHRTLARGNLNASGYGPGTTCRQDLQAVVGDPIIAVQPVGLLEAGHHLLDPRRAIDIQGLSPPCQPTLSNGLAQVADVVGVEVGKKDSPKRGPRQPPPLNVLPGAGAHVDKKEPSSGYNRRAGGGAVGVRKRRAGAGSAPAVRPFG